MICGKGEDKSPPHPALKNEPNLREMRLCSGCHEYSHLSCSRVTPQTLDELGGDSAVFKCLNCLFRDKPHTFFVAQTCESYLNIHHLIHRRKLLSDLCEQMLSKFIPD